jgi:hypothetical protein
MITGAASPQLASFSARSSPRRSAVSPATIQRYLSHLRVFAQWIGKPGMVYPAEAYVDDPKLVRRHYAAQRDKGWSAAGVDLAEVLR